MSVACLLEKEGQGDRRPSGVSSGEGRACRVSHEKNTGCEFVAPYELSDGGEQGRVLAAPCRPAPCHARQDGGTTLHPGARRLTAGPLPVLDRLSSKELQQVRLLDIRNQTSRPIESSILRNRPQRRSPSIHPTGRDARFGVTHPAVLSKRRLEPMPSARPVSRRSLLRAGRINPFPSNPYHQ